jgi:O-antigen/teichoic acid export membrane protein
LQLSDRYLLEHFASLSLAAGYSVAYSLGGIASAAVIAPFSLAWWVIMYPIAKREDAKQIFKLIFRGFSFALLFATLGLSLFARHVLEVLFPVSYHAQALIIPIIALSTLFSGISVVVGLGISLQRKTWLASICFIISALVNVGFNIILIPAHGAMGAALATLVAYVVLAFLNYLSNQWIYPVRFEVGLFLIALGISIALYFLANGLTQGQGMTIGLITCMGILLLYGLCLLLLGWFSLMKRRIHSFVLRALT